MVLRRARLALLLMGGCMTREALLDGDLDSHIGDQDCDPADPTVYRGSPYELSAGPNGVDDNCTDGIDEFFDVDLDGEYGLPYGEDCDDQNAEIASYLPEVARDGEDNNCDGAGTSWERTLDLDHLEVNTTEAVVLGGGGGRLGSSADGRQDLDGDGLADLVLGAPSEGDGLACVASGKDLQASESALPSLEGCTYSGSDLEGIGWSLSVGAMDGDSCPDLVLGLSDGGVGTGVRILLDAATTGVAGCSPHAPIDLLWSDVGDKDAVLLVGDLGGDGYDDLLIGVSGDASIVARLVAGTDDASTLASAPVSRTFAGTGDVGSERVVAAAGDVDGDDLQDALVGLPDQDGVGVVYLLLGSDDLDDATADEPPVPLDDVAAVRFAGGSGWCLGAAMAGGQDLDDDGDDDVALGAPGYTNAWGRKAGAALIYVNLPTAGDSSDAIIYAGASPDVLAGTSLAMPADSALDDGSDVLVGSTYASDEARTLGRAWLLLDPVAEEVGTESLLRSSEHIVEFTSANNNTWAVYSTGDVDLAPVDVNNRLSGTEVVLANPVDGEVFLFWGQGF